MSSPHDRKATWLELFYDLVYVIAIAKLAHFLEHHFSISGFLLFIGLFIPVWWTWVGHTLFSTRFDHGTLAQKLLTFGQMLGAAAMAVHIEHAYSDGAVGFAAAYACVRLLLVGMYLREIPHSPHARPLIIRLATYFSIGAGCWVASIFFPAPWNFVLWGIGLTVDLILPWTIGKVARHIPVHTAHMPERFGLFTLIVLGESVMGVVAGIDHVDWGGSAVWVAIAGFALAVSILWTYFSYVEHAPLQCSLGSGRPMLISTCPSSSASSSSGLGCASRSSTVVTGISNSRQSPF